MDNQMFCYQCQETMAGTGCTRNGMCGKKADTAAMQDLLVWVTKGLAAVATQLRREKKTVADAINRRIMNNLTAVNTNVNFDKDAIASKITATLALRDGVIGEVEKQDALPEAAKWNGAAEDFAAKAAEVGVLSTHDADIRSFRELITYAVKGIAAIETPAVEAGEADNDLDMFVARALSQTLDPNMTGGNLLALVMETGRYSVRAMNLADTNLTGAYGNPEPTDVEKGVRTNPAILVAGTNVHDLAVLLAQTEGTGVDVYTYDELLSAHSYPELKKYAHLAGNYGGSWWKQKEDFDSFNGPILMTEGNLVPPKSSYEKRLFTTGEAGFAGIPHIAADSEGHKDFSALIELAKTCAAPTEIGSGTVRTGYGQEALAALADQIHESIKNGSIAKIAVLAGDDGRAKTRSYYTDFVKALPDGSMVITAGSVYNRVEADRLGTINGIPALLHAGQLQDLYSIVQLALLLREKAGYDNLNQLPFVYQLSWHGQKAITALLSMLYLDIKHIHLGPTIPAFLSESVLNIFKKYFGITEITSVQEDIEAMMGKSDNLIQLDMIVSDIVQTYPSLISVMTGVGLHCISCGVSQMETLEEACRTHGLDPYDILDILNDQLQQEGVN
ncbi:MAG: hydroxylamine reductase [Eubacterium sp.]|nr:hydroxylamine reductase [Eubacterium sp.]